MAKVKGTTLLARLAFFQDYGGSSAEERVLARLSPEYADQLRKAVREQRWYPLGMYVELNRAMDEEFGNGDLSFIPELGRVVAKQVLAKQFTGMARPGHPRFLFEHAADVWGRFYDSGRLTVDFEGDTAIHVLIEDFDTPSREVCLAVQGWVHGNLEFAGARGVVIEELRCRAKGDAICEFRGHWN